MIIADQYVTWKASFFGGGGGDLGFAGEADLEIYESVKILHVGHA